MNRHLFSGLFTSLCRRVPIITPRRHARNEKITLPKVASKGKNRPIFERMMFYFRMLTWSDPEMTPKCFDR